jgi:hypothetical protein
LEAMVVGERRKETRREEKETTWNGKFWQMKDALTWESGNLWWDWKEQERSIAFVADPRVLDKKERLCFRGGTPSLWPYAAHEHSCVTRLERETPNISICP